MLVSFCFAFPLFSIAQQNQWVRTIDEKAVLMVPGQRGTFYTLSWQTNCPDDYIVVRFFKPDGTLQHAFKSFAYLGILKTYKACTNASNNLVMYLRDDHINHMFYEFDSSGVMQWNNNIQFTNPKILFEEFVPCSNGFYLAGSDEYSAALGDTAYGYLTKVNLQGLHQWTKRYRLPGSAGSNVRFHDLLLKQDTLFAVGHFFALPYIGWQPWRPMICKLDTAGNVLQSYYYMVDSSFIGFDEYSFQQIEQSSSGNYFLSGWNYGNEHGIFKLDPSLNASWIQYWSSGKVNGLTAGYNDDVWMIQANASSNYIFHMGSDGSVLPGHATKSPVGGPNLIYGNAWNIKKHDCGYLVSNDENLIMRVDTAMKNCLDTTYTDFELYSAETNYQRKTVSIVTQNVSPLGNYFTTAQYGVISSASVALCSSSLTTCNLNGPNSVNSLAEIVWNIYPNPASRELIIDLPETIEPGVFILYDMTGKSCFQKEFQSGGRLIINLPNLPSGNYSSVLRTNQGISRKQLSIQQ